MTFKPLLASPADLDNTSLPKYGSPKLDGIRAIVINGRVMSRKLIEIPNADIQRRFGRKKYEGFDGELIVGQPTADDCYNQTSRIVMAEKKPADDVSFWVFDHIGHATRPFVERYDILRDFSGLTDEVSILPQTELLNRALLDEYEENMVEQGYEGIMLRDPGAKYKYGRSTAKEGILLKVKRFEDSEAEIIGIEEEMFNGNEAGKDAFGRTKRSTAKAGKVGKGTMGALVVKDCKTGVEFNIGTGFTAAQRAETWPIGAIVKYKSFPVGVKDKPRHPVFIGFRDARDM